MPIIREVFNRIENHRINQVIQLGINAPDLIPLWFGESDVVTPDFIQRAALSAMQAGHTFYVNRRGILPLRQEIKSYLEQLYSLKLNLERITVTGSGITAIMITAQCLLSNNDNIVIISPIWPNIVYTMEIIGSECRHVRLDIRDNNWYLDLDKLFATCDKNTRAIFIATPSNPTGWVMEQDQQRAVLEFCRKRGIWIISDEVYHRFVYDRPVSPSFLEIADPEDALFVVQSFSKSWAMTGWRLGWLVHPVTLADKIGDLSAVNNTSATSFVQHAGVTAMREGESFIQETVNRCRKNRDLICEQLVNVDSIVMIKPVAAFYLFFAIIGIQDDLQFAKDLVMQSGVGLAPGSAFGPGNEGYFRLCFAVDEKKLLLAMDRLQRIIARSDVNFSKESMC